MKVVTLLDKGFDETCRDLAVQVDASYNPDLIIGVLTGGGYVGQRVYQYFAGSGAVSYAEINIERGTTGIKRMFGLRRMLRRLPVWLLNILRIVEVLMLEVKARVIVPKRSGEIVLSPEITKSLREGDKRVLVVDDCVDTGATLLKVSEHLKAHFPSSNELKFAVITKAHRKVLLEVDFFLFNRVLIRFPWSMDNKKDEVL